MNLSKQYPPNSLSIAKLNAYDNKGITKTENIIIRNLLKWAWMGNDWARGLPVDNDALSIARLGRLSNSMERIEKSKYEGAITHLLRAGVIKRDSNRYVLTKREIVKLFQPEENAN